MSLNLFILPLKGPYVGTICPPKLLRSPSFPVFPCMCLPNLLSFIFQNGFTVCLALKKVYKAREGQNLEIYLLLWKKHCHNFYQNWIFNRLFMSQYCSLICEKWWWLVCYAVADLASGISVLWPSLCFVWHTYTDSRAKHLAHVWCFMDYVRQLHKCACATPRGTILILPSEQLFCCRIYIVPLKNVIMHDLYILYIISNKHKWNK